MVRKKQSAEGGASGASGRGAKTKTSGQRAKSKPERPRLRASHSDGSTAPRTGSRTGGRARGAEPAPTRGNKRRALLDAAGAAPEQAGTRRAATVDTGRRAAPDARELATAIAMAGVDKKATAVEVLDVASKVDYADFVVIMTGTSDRHVQAIGQGIEESMHKRKVRPLSMEGMNQATWMLMDFGDVVVHIFQEEFRQVYDLEGLWIDATRLNPDALGS